MEIRELIDFEQRYFLWRSTQAGRRDTPGKGAGRETGARVQIPPSPFLGYKNFFKKYKKVVDKSKDA